MPAVFKSERPTKKLKLPTMPESEIEMYQQMTAGELFDFTAIPDQQRIGIAVASMIKSWNLVDEKGQPIAITAENIRALPLQDGVFLVAESGLRNINDELKKSASTS